MTTDSQPVNEPGSSVTFINLFEVAAEQLDAFAERFNSKGRLFGAKPRSAGQRDRERLTACEAG